MVTMYHCQNVYNVYIYKTPVVYKISSTDLNADCAKKTMTFATVVAKHSEHSTLAYLYIYKQAARCPVVIYLNCI